MSRSPLPPAAGVLAVVAEAPPTMDELLERIPAGFPRVAASTWALFSQEPYEDYVKRACSLKGSGLDPETMWRWYGEYDFPRLRQLTIASGRRSGAA